MKRGTARLRALVRARKFVRAFLAGPEGVRDNAAQSAIAAGYKPGNAVSASVQGARMANHPLVREMIARHLEREGITTQRVVHELASVALAKLSDVTEWDSDGVRVLKASRLLDEDTLAAVQEVESLRTVEHAPDGTMQTKTHAKVRLHDKVRALDTLLRWTTRTGDDAPREFTLVIGRAGAVQINAMPPDGPMTLRLGASPTSTNGDEAAPPDSEAGTT